MGIHIKLPTELSGALKTILQAAEGTAATELATLLLGQLAKVIPQTATTQGLFDSEALKQVEVEHHADAFPAGTGVSNS